MRGMSSLLILVVLGGLVGCVQAPKKPEFNLEMMTNIKTIVIAREPDQERYYAAVLAPRGMVAGQAPVGVLLVGIVAGVDMERKSTRLTRAINPAETVLQQRFEKLLTEKLSAVGYDTSTVLLPKDTQDADVPNVVRAQGIKSDAVLIVRMHGAYVAVDHRSAYTPNLFATVVMLDASDKELYSKTFSYGQTHPRSAALYFSPDAPYQFRTVNAMELNPNTTRDGLVAGLNVIATQIAADFKKP